MLILALAIGSCSGSDEDSVDLGNQDTIDEGNDDTNSGDDTTGTDRLPQTIYDLSLIHI